MPDLHIFLNDCVPEGQVTLMNVTPNEVLTRPYTFRVNRPPDVVSFLDNGTFGPRAILHGEDGDLLDGDGNTLAQVNTFDISIAFQNSDYSPGGERITWSIPNRYTCTLTLTETVVNDQALLAKVLQGLVRRQPTAVLNFQGVIHSYTSGDGTFQVGGFV
jgi:hypothetical protein